MPHTPGTVTCPQCASETDTLHEGYCESCRDANQDALDLHNAEYDHWRALTSAERERRIREALR
jgi:hypothetical protein